MLTELSELEKRIGYSFKNIALLRQALTHSSYKNPKSPELDNEQLEFLGDAVLELIISHLLLEYYASFSEGILTRMRASLVNEANLASMSKKLTISHHLRLGKGEFHAKGYNKPSILSDVFEAIIGAIYLDGGCNACMAVVRALFTPQIKQINPNNPFEDYKTLLQEYTQSIYKVTPTYKIEACEGPDHDKKFTIALCLHDKFIVRASGKNKKEAEQKAAKEALATLSASNTTPLKTE